MMGIFNPQGRVMQEFGFNHGDTMPRLGLGTWKSRPGEVYHAVREAIRVGYRHIDCAQNYGNEAEVGRALADAMAAGMKREELWITSKLWNDAHDPENVKPALETTLRNLRLDYLDLYLMHWPVALRENTEFPNSADDMISLEKLPLTVTWKAMEDCTGDGLTRHIGESNFSARKLQQVLEEGDINPAMNQVEMHPYLQQPDLLDFCRKKGIHVTAYSPLGSSDRPLGLKAENEPVLLEDPTIRGVAERHDASPAQVLIAWALERDTAVIPKSVNPERIRQNLEAAELTLTDSDMQALARLDRHRRYLSGDFWALPGSGYTVENLWDE
ncbi:MAG: aldo/keto reductase [Gammaproteobacteria bacterium]